VKRTRERRTRGGCTQFCCDSRKKRVRSKSASVRPLRTQGRRRRSLCQTVSKQIRESEVGEGRREGEKRPNLNLRNRRSLTIDGVRGQGKHSSGRLKHDTEIKRPLKWYRVRRIFCQGARRLDSDVRVASVSASTLWDDAGDAGYSIGIGTH